ncbi:hypothetical protein [Elizabethkingia anophelis]|uniref:hypothetical protein n=1 Tax=Elizabethkingia anophelis TaxID=1117645 RepID=UPI0016299AC9|nr:hypothetical protein [Elizabethkingia anophelis]MDV4116859.1 hypothetical protein [Elizabethkingia anophelis]
MSNFTNKIIEYNYVEDDHNYHVKAFVVSIPEDLKIKNIDHEENDGFIFHVKVLIEPELPTEIFDVSREMIFVVVSGGDHLFGYIDNGQFVKFQENFFIQLLNAQVLQVLMMTGDSGHYIDRAY